MIILLGLPKSGTSSFNYLFKELGFDSYHWKYKNKYIGELIERNKKLNKKLLSFIKSDNNKIALTQLDVCMNNYTNFWPQITDYRDLYNQNKTSIFILNKRNPYKIIKSMKNWKNGNGESLFNRIIKYNNDLLLDNDKLSNEYKLLHLIKNHYRDIELFFKSKPNAKFIIFDIDTDDISKLDQYIDIKNKSFPHINSSFYKLFKKIIFFVIFFVIVMIILKNYLRK